MPARVDRDRFLLMVAALSTSWCAEPRPSDTPAARAAAPRSAGEVEIETPAATEIAEPGVEEVVETQTGDPSCDNDAGQVDCSGIQVLPGPSCEGTRGSCELLARGHGYRPRVAARIAQCWTQLGSRVCNIASRERCNREAALEACPDPQYTSACEQIVENCKREGSRPRFSVDECTRVLSALDEENREWARGAMGPTREGCTLAFPVY